MVPAAFVFLAAMPLTPNGKVDRKGLPAPGAARPELTSSFAAPRDLLESQIAQIWATVLGVTSVGIKDKFLDLGGNSILAMRIMMKVHALVGQDIPVSVILQEETVENLAQTLKRYNGAGDTSPLVTIQRQGSYPPFFCVHPGSGDVLCYIKLAHHMGKEQPLYGLQAVNVAKGLVSNYQIEDIARNYIDAIRSIRPRGPFYLGGWSLGGVIAFEMARQLVECGEAVPFLALLDSQSPSERSQLSYRKNPGLVIGIAREYARQSGRSFPYTSDQLRKLSERDQLAAIFDFLKSTELVPQDADWSWMRRFVSGIMQRYDAFCTYTPKKYNGDIILFRAREIDAEIASDFGIDIEEDKADISLGWRKYTSGEVVVLHVPGDHATMITDPHVRVLAREIKQVLADIRDRR